MPAPTEFSFDTPKHAPPDLDAIQAAITAETGEAPDGTPPTEAAPHSQPATSDVITHSAAPAAKPAEEKSAQPSGTEPEKPQAEDLKTYKIVVDGQELEVTEADLKAGHMRQRDYTRKTQQVAAERQALAAERSQWEQERQAMHQEFVAIDQFLRDPAAVNAYIQKAFGAVPAGVAAPQIDPSKPPTAAEVAEIARYNAEQVRLYADQQLLQARREAAEAKQVALEHARNAQRSEAEKEVNTHISSLLERFPVLKKFENIDEELLGEAVRHMPTDRRGTLADAKQRLSEAAERRVATIRAIAEEDKRQAAVKAAQLKRTSTEAPGGTPPRQEPPRRLSLDTKDRKEFLRAAEEDLRAMLSAAGQ